MVVYLFGAHVLLWGKNVVPIDKSSPLHPGVQSGSYVHSKSCSRRAESIGPESLLPSTVRNLEVFSRTGDGSDYSCLNHGA